MTRVSEIPRVDIRFPILMTLTVIVCLAAIQFCGVDSSLPIATAAAVLVFCTRQPVYTTWELLEHVYLLRTSTSDTESLPPDWF